MLLLGVTTARGRFLLLCIWLVTQLLTAISLVSSLLILKTTNTKLMLEYKFLKCFYCIAALLWPQTPMAYHFAEAKISTVCFCFIIFFSLTGVAYKRYTTYNCGVIQWSAITVYTFQKKMCKCLRNELWKHVQRGIGSQWLFKYKFEE